MARKTRNALSQVNIKILIDIYYTLERLLEIERLTGMEFLGETERVKRIALRSTMNFEGDLEWAFKEPSSSPIAALGSILYLSLLLFL